MKFTITKKKEYLGDVSIESSKKVEYNTEDELLKQITDHICKDISNSYPPEEAALAEKVKAKLSAPAILEALRNKETISVSDGYCCYYHVGYDENDKRFVYAVDWLGGAEDVTEWKEEAA